MTSTVFRIGGDLPVRRMGFGAMRLPTEPDQRASSIAVAQRAVELGINLVDTALMYGWGDNEELLAEALHPYRDDLVVTTKVGLAPTSTGEITLDGRPEALREQVEGCLRRLRVDRIELLQLHRLDPKTPLAAQIGTLERLQSEGKIGRIGLSEVSVNELAQAREIASISSVQNRYNLLDREHDDVLLACETASIAFLPWRPVAHGDLDHPEIAAVASELDATASQVALAWLLDRSPVMLPIPGTAQISHLEENLAAEHLQLTADHRARLDRLADSR